MKIYTMHFSENYLLHLLYFFSFFAWRLIHNFSEPFSQLVVTVHRCGVKLFPVAVAIEMGWFSEGSLISTSSTSPPKDFAKDGLHPEISSALEWAALQFRIWCFSFWFSAWFGRFYGWNELIFGRVPPPSPISSSPPKDFHWAGLVFEIHFAPGVRVSCASSLAVVSWGSSIMWFGFSFGG